MIAREPNGTYTIYGYGKPEALLEGLTFEELNNLARESSWKVMEEDGTIDEEFARYPKEQETKDESNSRYKNRIG